jgi:hypothetical protein
MKKSTVLLSFSLLLPVLPGCQKSETARVETMPASSKSNSIVIDIGERFDVQHEAQAGQMLEWRSSSPQTPNFWIQFSGPSPCTNRATVLPGSATASASCLAGPANATGGTVTYSYFIRASAPPPSTKIPERAVPCVGCNN